MTAHRRRLVLATTCADRKAAVAPDRVRLRDVPGGAPVERARAWSRRLRAAPGGRDTPDHLYLGDHWKSSLRAFEAAMEAGFSAELWVISAGYGLYPATAAIASYAATFVLRHPDSVVPPEVDGGGAQAYLSSWWDAVARHLPVAGASVRTFSAMAEEDPDVLLLVVSGGAYLEAITNDLMLARASLRRPEQLIVVSGGASGSAAHPLAGHIVPVDARFQALVGGGRSALNARVAGWLLGHVLAPGAFDLSWARDRLAREGQSLPDAPRYERRPMSDEQVCRWIRNAAGRVARPSASALLRQFRDAGLACEQKRFSGLYARVAATKHKERI